MLADQLFDDMAEIVVWGNPWHGIVNGGTLYTGLGVTREWTQPDSGDCWLVKAHDVAEVERSPEQLAIDAAAGAEWRNYALLTGWYNRQLYGKPMNAGADSNQRSVYVPKAGYGWSVYANLSAAGTAVAGNLVFSRLHLGSTEQQTVAINQAVTWPFSTGAYWELVAKNPDGSKLVFGLWSVNAYGTSNPLNYKHSYPNQRARAKVNESTSSGIWSTRHTRVIAPFQYVLVTLTGGDDETPTITATPSLLYSFTDTEKVIKTNVTVTPFDRIDLYFVFDGVNYSYQEVAAGAPGPGGSLVEDSLPKNTAVFESETETIVGVYFDMATGNLKTVKVRTYTTNSQTWTYDYGTPGPSMFNFRRDNTVAESGTIKLEIDGTVVSTATFTAAWTAGEMIDWSFAHQSFVDGSATGEADIDGTPFYSETKVVSNPNAPAMFMDLRTREGVSGSLIGNYGWLTIDAHGLEYSSGAFGLVLDLNMVPPGGGMARTIVAGGVASVVTKTRGSTIGTVSTSGGYVNYVYENIKVSHHPVTGNILQNAGVWV